jgi:hypothetical protein
MVHLKSPKIYVSGLPFEATEGWHSAFEFDYCLTAVADEIKSFFSRFGNVDRVEIIRHHGKLTSPFFFLLYLTNASFRFWPLERFWIYYISRY